jgi:integrase
VPTLEEVFEFSDHKELIFTKIRTNRPLSASAHLDIPRNLMNWIKGRYLKKGETMKDWSMHDLRRTMRTNMSSITSRHVAEIMVGHKQPEIEQVYDHYHYLDEQRQAYTHWFDYIESLVGEF